MARSTLCDEAIPCHKGPEQLALVFFKGRRGFTPQTKGLPYRYFIYTTLSFV